MNLSPIHHRSLWSIDALTSQDLASLLDSAHSLKAAAEAGHPHQPLRGKNVAVMCESDDDQALQGFTAAASALGARVAHIRPSSSRITQPGGSQETAQLLGRLYDAIDCEGLPGAVVRDLERGAGRPVFNGLAEAGHPLRVLGDLMTLREHSGKPLNEISVCFRGDASSPEGDAWLQSAALAGLSLRIASPAGQRPAASRLERARRVAHETGAQLELCEPTEAATDNTDFVWDEQLNRRCADGRVELACGCRLRGAPPHAPLCVEQMNNRLYALQALLCSAVS